MKNIMIQKKNIILRTSIFIIIIILVTNFCFARAGGGGGGFSGRLGGEGSFILALILSPFLLIYSAILTITLIRKKNKVKSLSDELSEDDKMWNQRLMLARVKEVFFKVQKAWMERNQDIAKDCMSPKIYDLHKLQTDELINKGHINMLERMNLIEAVIFSVMDFKDNSLDTFSVQIKGSMVDYMIDEKTKKVISGDENNAEDFKEIWKFIRIGNKWVLDDIDQKVSLYDILSGEIYVEK